MNVNINKPLFIYTCGFAFYLAIAKIWSPWVALSVIAVEVLARILVNAYALQKYLDAQKNEQN